MIQFKDLTNGDRFRFSGNLWTKLDFSSARQHSDQSIILAERGYGYAGDLVCNFALNERIEFVAPQLDFFRENGEANANHSAASEVTR